MLLRSWFIAGVALISTSVVWAGGPIDRPLGVEEERPQLRNVSLTVTRRHCYQASQLGRSASLRAKHIGPRTTNRSGLSYTVKLRAVKFGGRSLRRITLNRGGILTLDFDGRRKLQLIGLGRSRSGTRILKMKNSLLGLRISETGRLFGGGLKGRSLALYKLKSWPPTLETLITILTGEQSLKDGLSKTGLFKIRVNQSPEEFAKLESEPEPKSNALTRNAPKTVSPSTETVGSAGRLARELNGEDLSAPVRDTKPPVTTAPTSESQPEARIATLRPSASTPSNTASSPRSLPSYLTTAALRRRRGQAIQQDPHKFDDIVERAARRWGLNVSLLRGLIQTESRFDPGARSHTDAGGLGQFTNIAVKEVRRLMAQSRFSQKFQGEPKLKAELSAFTYDKAYIPEIAIEATALYLSSLLKTYGHVEAALTAYNAGTAMANQVRRYGSHAAAKRAGVLTFSQASTYAPEVLHNKHLFDSGHWPKP